MRLGLRVAAIERRAAIAGVCAVCHGEGRVVVVHVPAEAAAPAPLGCPECGRLCLITVEHVEHPIPHENTRSERCD